MAIEVQIIILNIPYGNPGSVGEPLGIWTGEVNVAGDASGGTVNARFQPQNPATTPTLDDQRRQYVWFVDGLGFLSNVDPVEISREVRTHWARANSAIGQRFTHTKNILTRSDGVLFTPTEDLIAEHITRTPIFWDTQELTSGNNDICSIRAQANVDLGNYEFRCYGRYYDRQILSNRAFGRLISPPAISQFEG